MIGSHARGSIEIGATGIRRRISIVTESSSDVCRAKTRTTFPTSLQDQYRARRTVALPSLLFCGKYSEKKILRLM